MGRRAAAWSFFEAAPEPAWEPPSELEGPPHEAPQDLDLDSVTEAFVSYGAAVVFATRGAALALRVWQLLRPQVVPEEEPTFEPFAGRAYHLKAEEKEEKQKP